MKISVVEDTEIFKVCLDYWNWLCAELYRECPFQVEKSIFSSFSMHNRGDAHQDSPRRPLYNKVLSDVSYFSVALTQTLNLKEVTV